MTPHWLSTLRYLVLPLAVLPLSAAAEGITQLRAFVSQTQSLSATFNQEVTGGQASRASGTLELKRPGRFRWTYDTPFAQLIVGDGKRLWVFDKELNQVSTRKLDDALGSSPAALLAGSNHIDRDYTLKNLGEKDKLEWLEAIPKQAEGTFKWIRMGFREGQLIQMQLADNFGQTTRLTFSQIKKNPALAEGRFRFTPPKGADVMGE